MPTSDSASIPVRIPTGGQTSRNCSRKTLTKHAHVHGFKWAEAECLEIMIGRRVSKNLRTVQKCTPKWVLTLVSLVKPLRGRCIQGNRAAFETRNRQKPAPEKAVADYQRRLVWDFYSDEYDDISVTPREQRTNKNGTWSRGRSVALKRLLEKMGAMDFLQEQDRAAAAKVKHESYGWRGHKRFYLPLAGLYELAGHPYVFHADADWWTSFGANRNCWWMRKPTT